MVNTTSPHVVVFCGAHAPVEEHADLAYQVGKSLAEAGFVTVTGGGPGMMQRVNQGAKEAGGWSIGHCLALKEEAPVNFLDEQTFYETLAERQKALLDCGEAFIALPGGLGTLYEVLDITQRKRFGELPIAAPMILLTNYYQQFYASLNDFNQAGYIAEHIPERVKLAHDVETMMTELQQYFAKDLKDIHA